MFHESNLELEIKLYDQQTDFSNQHLLHIPIGLIHASDSK